MAKKNHISTPSWRPLELQANWKSGRNARMEIGSIRWKRLGFN